MQRFLRLLCFPFLLLLHLHALLPLVHHGHATFFRCCGIGIAVTDIMEHGQSNKFAKKSAKKSAKNPSRKTEKTEKKQKNKKLPSWQAWHRLNGFPCRAHSSQLNRLPLMMYSWQLAQLCCSLTSKKSRFMWAIRVAWSHQERDKVRK